MNTEAFLKAYRDSRNGTDSFHFNPLYRKFLYSDGVKECAEAGCYWLLDILGTELPEPFAASSNGELCIVTVTVKDKAAVLSGSFQDDGLTVYTRSIDYTDMPEGTWTFAVADDADGFLRCILLTEY